MRSIRLVGLDRLFLARAQAADPPLEAGKAIALPPGGKRLLRLAAPMDPRPGTWRVHVQVEAALLDERGTELGRVDVHSSAVIFRS